MMRIKRLTAAIAVLLLTAATAWSQPAAEAENDAAASAPQQPSGGSEAGNDGAAADSTPTPTSRAPGDYRASEQISEDLSVSFPVDI